MGRGSPNDATTVRIGPAMPPLADDAVHLWVVDLDATPDRGADLMCVAGSAAPRLHLDPAWHHQWTTEDERVRATRFKRPRDGDRFLVARAALRGILGGYLRRDPAALVFGHGPRGKPVLPGSPLCFNVSHSESLALVVVAHGRQVGVDLEQVRPVPESDAIAARVCSPREQEALGRVPPADRPGAFLALWTCKEALAKLTGEGVGALPRDVARDAPPGCRMEPLHDLPGYAACVAAEGTAWRLERPALTSWIDDRSPLEWCALA